MVKINEKKMWRLMQQRVNSILKKLHQCVFCTLIDLLDLLTILMADA